MYWLEFTQRSTLYLGNFRWFGDSQVELVVKNLSANAEDLRDVGSIPGQEDPLEEEMATHFSILVWRVPWTEEPSRLPSTYPRVRYD